MAPLDWLSSTGLYPLTLGVAGPVAVAVGRPPCCSAAARSASRRPWPGCSGPRGATPASRNANQLACFAEYDNGVSDGLGRPGPAAMAGAFELVAAHLALHRTRVGSQPASGQLLGEDLADRPPDRPGDLVRGKTPRGWPGAGARSAACR